MAYNEARKRASVKYEQEKLAPITLRVRKEEKQEVQAEAAASGVSLRRYIIEAINAKAGRELIGYAGESSEE